MNALNAQLAALNATLAETMATAARLERERDEALDVLADMVGQHCDYDDYVDSIAISANARAMRLLARHHRLTIDAECGRRVIARWAGDSQSHDGVGGEMRAENGRVER